MHLKHEISRTESWKGRSGAHYSLLVIAALLALSLLAQSAQAQTRQVDLTLRLVSHWDTVEAKAGQDNLFFLEIDNIGSREITEIRLSSEQPEGWTVDISPQEIDLLAPASIQTVDVNIRPPGNATRREQRVSFIAEAKEIRRVQVYWVAVKTALWLWVGAGGVLTVVLGFALVYLRFGRQT